MKIVRCVKVKSEIKVSVDGEDGFVQFPKDIRIEGKVFAVEDLVWKGKFWTVTGEIFDLTPLNKKSSTPSKHSSNKKKMFYYYDDRVGETQFFFDGDEVIHDMSLNDGDYRHEYMRSLFEHYGVKVEYLKKLSPAQEKSFVAYCNKHNRFEY